MKHALPLIGLLLTFASTAHAQTFACASDSVLLDAEADAELYLWQLLDDVEWARSHGLIALHWHHDSGVDHQSG